VKDARWLVIASSVVRVPLIGAPAARAWLRPEPRNPKKPEMIAPGALLAASPVRGASLTSSPGRCTGGG
jgi:uncharacterized membrane protein